MVLLNESKDVFRLGGEPTPFVKHFINTGDHPPVSTAPYRLSPNSERTLIKEIDNLLADNIIEECESPYAAPVVFRAVQNALDGKATNQKPAGLLQTPVPAQRFESIAIDLFWSLTRNDRRYEVDFHSGGLHNKMGRVIPIKASYC
ncbi:retrovirus-related Pol polyprotein from transposon 297 [Trichonephila clavipes]|nr:retrovirus-related Pol polyprotein from transposon 297 [Trichonephila clavipes]